MFVSTLSGLPVAHSLVPANTDERAIAESVLGNFRGCDFCGDKGFIGLDWQEDIEHWTGNRIWTTRRQSQHLQNPAAFDCSLSHFWERIEGVSHEVQNTGRHLKHLLHKSFEGLLTHVPAQIASYTLRLLLSRVHGIDVLSFQWTTLRTVLREKDGVRALSVRLSQRGDEVSSIHQRIVQTIGME